MVEKRILCPERLRHAPKQFSWVDHRLVRDKRICGLSHQALSLYLFLVTAGDADGLSFSSDGALERYLDMDTITAGQSRVVPGAVMVDNLKCAVIKRLVGQAPVFNPRYLDFTNHYGYGYKIRACGMGKGNEKGRVENAA